MEVDIDVSLDGRSLIIDGQQASSIRGIYIL